MSRKNCLLFFALVSLAIGGRCRVWAEDPLAAAPPGAAATGGAYETTVYLKQDYVDALKGTGLFEGNKFFGSFQRFDNGFAVFKRKGNKESIYIPKAAILYMSGRERAVLY